MREFQLGEIQVAANEEKDQAPENINFRWEHSFHILRL